MHGFTARFTTASAMLGDLDAQDGAVALRRRLHRYVKPALLVIDELGYLLYSNRYADLLFEVVTQSSRARPASARSSIASATGSRSSRSPASPGASRNQWSEALALARPHSE
jgi:DNA replication protein DnaC